MEQVMRDGEGRVIARPANHGKVTIKVANGTATIFETDRAVAETGGPGIHSHPGFDETFYVLAGEWEFYVEDRRIIADAGTTIHLPRGVFHAYRSTGRVPGRILGIAIPGGIEDFFEESASAKDSTETAAVGERHGIHFTAAPTPQVPKIEDLGEAPPELRHHLVTGLSATVRPVVLTHLRTRHLDGVERHSGLSWEARPVLPSLRKDPKDRPCG